MEITMTTNNINNNNEYNYGVCDPVEGYNESQAGY